MAVKIIFVGDVMQDILISYQGKIAYGSDTYSNIKIQGGGSAASTAAWAATQEIEVGLTARIGDDQTASLIKRDLKQPYLYLNLVETQNCSSGSCAILIDPDGERTMFPDAGANIFLTENDIPSVWWETAQLIHISAYSLLRPQTKVAISKIIAKAKSLKIKTSVDVASSKPLEDNDGFNALSDLGPWDFLFANKDEAEVLGEISKIKSLCKNLILKRGNENSRWLSSDFDISAIPEKIKIKDLIGAGDAFAAGLLTSYIKKIEPIQCLKNANTLGGKCVQIEGSRPYPSL